MAKPTQTGWHWMTLKDERNPKLVRCIVQNGDIRIFLDNKYMDEGWAYVAQQMKPTNFEYLGLHLPPLINPKEDGYHWMTCRDGTRHIVRLKLRRHADHTPMPVHEWDAEIVGSNQTYYWTRIIEGYQVIRLDFLAPADLDYHRSRLS